MGEASIMRTYRSLEEFRRDYYPNATLEEEEANLTPRELGQRLGQRLGKEYGKEMGEAIAQAFDAALGRYQRKRAMDEKALRGILEIMLAGEYVMDSVEDGGPGLWLCHYCSATQEVGTYDEQHKDGCVVPLARAFLEGDIAASVVLARLEAMGVNSDQG
jgi:hypothetical protein